MAWDTPQLDPERCRRRLQLLAELAGARTVRQRKRPQRVRTDALRQLIATRRPSRVEPLSPGLTGPSGR